MEVAAFCSKCGEDTVQEVGDGGDAFEWHLICTECGSENVVEQ